MQINWQRKTTKAVNRMIQKLMSLCYAVMFTAQSREYIHHRNAS